MTQSDLSSFSAAADAADETDVADATDPADAAAVVAGNGGGRISEVVDVEDARFPDSTGTVELMVTQVDYTIEGSGREEHPVIHVFGRRDDGTHEHVRVLGFEPYFYVPTDSLDTPPEEAYDVVVDSRETDPDGDSFESIRGEKLTKIIGRTPRDVGEIRDDFDHYEADILFPNRFLIDKGINSGIEVSERRLASDGDDDPGTIQVPHTEVVPADVDSDLRVNVFDIEVDDRRGFPEDGEEPIVCLTSYDSFDEEYVAWLYEAPDGDGEIPDDLPDYEPYQDDIAVDVRAFESEAAMLDAFIDYIDDTDPDLLTGWNFEDFDAPYFLDRLEVLDGRADEDLSIDRLSRIDEVWRSGWGGPDIKGRVVFDLLYGYKRTQFTELDSYRLDAVGELELGVGKERYAGDIGDLWEDDPTQLLEYNLRDVELCVEIDRKQGLIDFWDEVRKFVGCKLEDAPTPGDAVDQYVLHKAYGKFALPTKGQQESEDFEGGAVFDPISGVRENISVLDLKSLYPMCMVTINAGPETKVDDEFDGETYRAPNGTRFRKEPDGIMREMVDDLLSEREEKKELRDQHDPDSDEYVIYDTQQAAIKVIMNSLYGVTGWDRFRLYDKEGAAAVTATGREVIDFTETVASELNYQVAYGDTDSVMLELDSSVKKSEAIDQSFEIEEYINSRYDDFASDELNADEHRFQIEFEKLYRRFFQAGRKKRYAGHIIWKEGKDVDDIDITGFEYKRSDIAPITKQVQKEVIETIVTGDELAADRQQVREYLTTVIEEFLNGERSVEEIGIPGGIGKRLDAYETPTAQVRGAQYANLLLGTNFDRGSKPKRLYLKDVHSSFFRRMEDEKGLDPRQDPLYGEFKRDPDVICFEYADQLPEEFEIDLEKMLDKTLKGPISRVIEALGMSWDEIKTGQTQTGLEQYW